MYNVQCTHTASIPKKRGAFICISVNDGCHCVASECCCIHIFTVQCGYLRIAIPRYTCISSLTLRKRETEGDHFISLYVIRVTTAKVQGATTWRFARYNSDEKVCQRIELKFQGTPFTAPVSPYSDRLRCVPSGYQ